MTAENDKARALYLVNPDTGRVELVHADDVEDRQGAGWKLPTGMKANGEPWNDPEEEADAVSAASNAAEVARANTVREERIEARKAEEREAERAEAEKAQAKAEADNPPTPDFKVQVVEVPAPKVRKSTK